MGISDGAVAPSSHALVTPLLITICYGANEMCDVRIHMQGFIYKGEVKKQARVR